MRNNLVIGSLLLSLIYAPSAIFAQQTATVQSAASAETRNLSPNRPSAPVTVENIESDISEALTVIQDNYVGGAKLNYNDVFKSSINGMLRTLDPHSDYFDPKEFEEFRTEQRSQYFGIGASIGDLRDGETVWTYIKSTFEGAPANRAGLRFGDKILEVNGVSMRGKSFTEVRTNLLGPRGTTAKIKVERNGTKQIETVEIIRDAVPQPSIPESYMIRPKIGYIAMTGGFTQTTYGEFERALKELKAQGAENLIIDLRNNGGGLVGQAFRVASTFLESGQKVLTQKGRARGNTGELVSDNKTPERMPLVVLINRNSASASEILSGALQDHDRALIVGENSFGKGLVQTPFPMSYDTMVLLTTAKYLTPSGRLIQRDYSNGNIYDYYTQGGTLRDDKSPSKPSGPEVKTDSGRTVYGGGGITPDTIVKPETITIARARLRATLNDPIFAFSLALTAGQVKGFETLKNDSPIRYNQGMKQGEFAVDEKLFQAFKAFALANPQIGDFVAEVKSDDKNTKETVKQSKPAKISPALIDREREYIERRIRFELATAAYGATTPFQIYNEADNQLLKAVELLPQAKTLAQTAENIRRNTIRPNNE